MSVSFVKILTMPLLPKNFFKLVLKLSLLFLPSILSGVFFGLENWTFRILFFITLIILNGYLWQIFQQELEKNNGDFPSLNLINSFFTGIKGIIFFLASVALLLIVLVPLWIWASYMPNSSNIALIAGIIWSIYWLFMVYPVSTGMFADDFNPSEAVKVGIIFQVISGAWLNYLKAIVYLLGYVFIIGAICWAFTILLGANYNYLIFGFFIVYAFIVYFLLYANIFKEVKAEFESHL